MSSRPDPMTPDRWRQIQDLLADAIECPPAARAALLDARCADDRWIRSEVESLLVAHDGEGVVDHLTPLLQPAAAWLRTPANNWSGHRIGQYVVQEPVGSGGMAIVHKANDERLGRQVALKFLSPHLSADSDAKSRLMAEARTAAALDHPNVCTVFEIGETDDGQLFIAMPLYDGETVQTRLDRGRFTFEEALPIVLQVARGLEHAHAAGVVHRDIKPSNILILPDGTVKILDFGIARFRHAALADSHTAMGTIPYMSPEQGSGGAVDARSDIWSLAIVIHEMLSAVRPFRGEDGMALLLAIRERDPDLTATSHPDVPTGMERVLRRALAKAPDDRYPSLSVMAEDLSALTGDAESEQLSVDSPPAGAISLTERRRAAVLVTAVCDYASLVDQVTPADAHRLIARLRADAVDVVRQHGGLVNQAIGDEIVSLFGVPVAHEDDDLRAARAALALHGRVQGQDQGDMSGVRLRVRSGLHVGAVVARRLQEGPRRYDVVGAPATLAARLAALADADDVWVSPETQRLVAPYMRTLPCAPVVLDSQAGPVTPFRVVGETGIATRLEASTRTGLTPYVGRQSELSILQSTLVHAAYGTGAVVVVVGEAGAGKSRLLHELTGSLRTANVRVLHARCRAYGDSVPYGVFVQILCAALDLRPPLAAPDVIARIRALDRSLEPFLPLFLHLLSVPADAHALPRHLEGQHLEAALLEGLGAFVAALTRKGSVVVLVEDWHWADAGSRAAFMGVSDLIASTPLVLIATSRVEPRTQTDCPGAARIVRLDRLDFTASLAIVEAALMVTHVPEALARRLDERAGGNPFFLEQMCAALLEQQTVTVRDGNALVEGDENALLLPDTVQGVIRARLDNLDAQASEIVRVASVIGREFDYAVLAEIAPAHVDLSRAIAALESAGLIQQTAFAPTVGYRFTHALTQEVCYDSLLGHQRKTLHQAIGAALTSHADRVDERAALLAHHFGRAEDWPAAIRFSRRAAHRAVSLSQFGDALATLDQALEWVGRLRTGQPGLTVELLLQQERVCETLGLRARQQQIIDALIAHLAREGSSVRLAEVYLRQGDLSTLLKRFDAADRALATALRIGQERGDSALLRSALRSLGLLRWHEERHTEALDIMRRALALDRECDDEAAVAVDLSNLASILRAVGDFAGARAKLEEALTMPVLRDDPKKVVYTRHNLANVYREAGDVDGALACLMESDEIARVHLLPIQRSFHLTSIAHIQLQQGHVAQAAQTYRAAVDLSRRARHAEGLVQSLRMLANLLLGLARYEEALPHLREAAELFAQLEDRVSEAEMQSGVARVLERTSPDEAARAWNVVLDLQRRRGDAKGELDAREGLARMTRGKGADQAIPAFESALVLAATIGDSAREAAIRNMLGILEWERGSYAAALAHYECALALVRGQGTPGDEAVVLNSLGVTLTALGRSEEARTVLEESLAIARGIGQRQLEAHALFALGQVALHTYDFSGAAEAFEQSRLVRHEIGDRAGEGWMHLRVADVRTKIGDTAGVYESVAAAAAVAADVSDAALARACTEAALARDYQSSGETGNAALHHRAIGSGSHT